MTSKKNMRTNRTPRRIHRNKGGRKKGVHYLSEQQYNREKQNYRASEGKVVQVPYRGSVIKTIEEILGGLRSACTYAGAQTLKALPKCTTFVRVNRQLNEAFN